jgi:hypothetical protein
LDGKILINPQFESAKPFNSNNLACVESNKNFGYIDKQGKIQINPQFDDALSFNGETAIVQSSSKFGLIDKDGKYTTNPQFDNIAYDYFIYVFKGGTLFSEIETDYFDVNSIISRIEKAITLSTFENGLDLNTPMSTLLSKFNKTENDFSKYGELHDLISLEKISNDATLRLVILANPWSTINDGWFSYSYVFNYKLEPKTYAYIISLTGRGYDKADNLFNAFANSFKSLKKDDKNCDKNNLSFLGDTFSVWVRKKTNSDINVVVNTIENSFKSISQKAEDENLMYLADSIAAAEAAEAESNGY